MLKIILETIEVASSHHPPQDTPQVTPQVNALLKAMNQPGKNYNRDELQQALSLKDRKSFRERYLKSALENGLIEMTFPDKPNTPLQKYRLTEKGLAQD